ncbi:MAG TPA: hypothetical protein VEL82_00420 [Thermoplasmata archaeon]|nr:hypothetical protein [Thermoplasmata archaeon]
MTTSGPAGPDTDRARGRRRRWTAGVAAAALTAIVVVAGLYVGGYLGAHPGASLPPYLTFSQAASAAESRSGSAAGGPWFGVAADAIVTPVAVLEPAANLTSLLGLADCTVNWTSGMPSNLAVPATAATAELGTAAYWTVLLKNATNALLVDSVSQGKAASLATLTGGDCARLAGSLLSFGAGLVDSPQAVSAANAMGGASFLDRYPNASETWAVAGGFSLGGILTTSPEWLLEYTTCSFPPAAGAQGLAFNATVGGTSGVVTNHTSGPVSCSLTIPSGLTLGLPAPTGPPVVGKAI